MKVQNITIGLFLLVLMIILYFTIYLLNQNVLVVTSEDENYMYNFDIYGDFLFQMYGILGMIKSIFYDLNNLDTFNVFLKENKDLFQYNYGDIIEFKSGKVNFSTKIIQKNYNEKQTYLEVIYPINDDYYIIFDRIIQYLYLSSDINDNVDRNNYRERINKYKLSLSNKDFLSNLIEIDSNLIEQYTNALGYCYTLQHFINKYNNFDRALNIIKKYNKLFISKYGEGVFVHKNINTIKPFSFTNNNDNYAFQDDMWIYYYNTNVEKTKQLIGTNQIQRGYYKQVKDIYLKAGQKYNNRNVGEDIVDKLIKGQSIISYQWFNNIFQEPIEKQAVIFGYKEYFYGSGFTLPGKKN